MTRSSRHYPAFYEKGIPVLLGFIVLLALALLVLAVLVVLGLFPS